MLSTSARANRLFAVGRYVGGLAPGVAEGDLRDQFYPFGEIRSIRVRPCRSCMRGQRSGQPPECHADASRRVAAWDCRRGRKFSDLGPASLVPPLALSKC
jgi:hypothetical protein